MNRLTKALRRTQTAARRFVMRFAGGSWGYGGSDLGFWDWASGVLRGTRYNYAAQVGDGSGNSAVQACVQWIQRTFPEAPIRVQQRAGDSELTPMPRHPLALLCERPNPYYSGPLLWMATVADFNLCGNAYWLKQRAGDGRVVQLWWTPSYLIEPRWDSATEFISYYEYRPGTEPIRLPPSEVVHFRFGLDPKNVRKGLSPLGAALREVFSDDEASNFAASLLRNMGIPGVVISPEGEGQMVDAADAEAVKADFAQKFGGDNRGAPMVMPLPTKISVLSFNPKQMDLRDLRKVPEERISACLGIPAIVAGLGAGLDRSTFANMAEAREMAYESNIIPTQRLLAADIAIQLLPDLGDAETDIVDFDVSGVRVLQEDENDRHNRIRDDFLSGVLSWQEARAALGKDAEPDDDALFTLSSLTRAGMLRAEPAPEPAPALPLAARAENRARDPSDLIAAGPAAGAGRPSANDNGRVYAGVT